MSFTNSLASARADISLTETEESWDKICGGIVSFSTSTRTFSVSFPHEIIATARELHRPIINALKSERTQLSGSAIDLILALASELGTAFEPLLPLFFPALLLLCARTSKVVVGRARTCVLSIIEATQLVSALPFLVQSIGDKSISLRVIAAEGMLACLKSLNPPDLEKEERVKDIEAFIKLSVRDPNPEVRRFGKQIYQAYEMLLPTKTESFVAPLSPTSKKYLGLSSRLKSSKEEIGAHVAPRLAKSSSFYARPSVPKIYKKLSQPALHSSASVAAANAPQMRPEPSSVIVNYRPQPPSRPASAADTYTAIHATAKEDRSRPVRPHLLVSRSESSTATAKHARSVSASSYTPGPIRFPNIKPLSHSASSKPANVSAVPPRMAVSPTPDTALPSKATVGPLRIDPSAGRKRIPPSKKPVPPILSTEEPMVAAIGRPEEEEGSQEKPPPKKLELPKLTRGMSENLKKTSVFKALEKATEEHSIKALNERESVPPRDGSHKVKTSKLSSSSHQSTASSRARTVSATSTSTKPLVSRTRTTSTSAAIDKLPSTTTARPAARTGEVPVANLSATAVDAARARDDARFRAIGTGVPHSSAASKVKMKLTRGITTSTLTRQASSKLSGNGSIDPVAKSKATAKPNHPKQKRPSVVPEEVDIPQDLQLKEAQRNAGGQHPDAEANWRCEVSQNARVIENSEESFTPPVVADKIEREGQSGEDRDDEEPLLESSVVQKESEEEGGRVCPDAEKEVGNDGQDCLIDDASERPVMYASLPTHFEPLVDSDTLLTGPQTPARNVPESALHGDPTPISALLSSIQRGFLFTPASPLSPPDSYLMKGASTTLQDLVPFPLFQDNGNSRSNTTQSRQVLETMDTT